MVVRAVSVASSLEILMCCAQTTIDHQQAARSMVEKVEKDLRTREESSGSSTSGAGNALVDVTDHVGEILTTMSWAVGGKIGLARAGGGFVLGGMLCGLPCAVVGGFTGWILPYAFQELLDQLVEALKNFVNRLLGIDGCCVAFTELELSCGLLAAPTEQEVTNAYRFLATQNHPDKVQAAEDKDRANAKMIQINAARDTAKQCARHSWWCHSIIQILIVLIVGAKALSILYQNRWQFLATLTVSPIPFANRRYSAGLGARAFTVAQRTYGWLTFSCTEH